MLTLFRAFLGTWAARAFFVVLLASFGLWGIADVVRNLGHDTALATVGDRTIDPIQFQQTFRDDLTRVTRMMGNQGEVAPEIRRAVADQALEELVIQAAVAAEVQRLGIEVPDAALRRAVFEMPTFKGRGGVFDHGVLEAVLRNNGMTEARFLEGLRSDLGKLQLLDTVQTGVVSPETPIRQVYAAQHEQRTGDLVEVPSAASADPPAPSEQDLQRAYENNPAAYTTPEMRRIALVVLSPSLIARGIEVPEEEIRGYYDQHRSEYQTPESRAANIVIAGDQATADKLAAQWRAGADWAAMDQAAKAVNATSLSLDPSTRQQIPAADLADAVFGATPGAVTGPVKTAAGFAVLQVTKADGGQRSYDDVKGEIRDRLALERAADQADASSRKLQDALSAGTDFDHLPGDLGVVAMTGTTDAQGNTPDGQPAPIPGSPALRQAILQTAFATAKGDPARLLDGPEQSQYALIVEEITPATLKPLAAVQDQVKEDWIATQRKRGAEKVAAGVLAATQGGTSLEDAALKAGLRVDKTPALTRAAPGEHVAPSVQQALFQLKAGETTMVETPDGYAVVRLATVTQPDPAADPAGLAQAREGLTRSLGQDVTVTVATILRDRAAPRINRSMLDSLIE